MTMEEPDEAPSEPPTTPINDGPASSEPTNEPLTTRAVEPALRPVLQVMEKEGVPELAQVRIIRAIREYSGPLPPPEMLKEYSDACPGGAERIMAAFESETSHRQEMERLSMAMQQQALSANIGLASTDQRLASRGQLIACVLAALFGVSGYLLGMHNHDWLAGTLYTSTIGAVLAAFVIGAKKKKDAPAQDNDDSDGEGETSAGEH